MKNRHLIFFFLLLAQALLFAQAPDVQIKFWAEPDTAIIGDVIHFKCTTTYDDNVTVSGLGLQAIQNEWLEIQGKPSISKGDSLQTNGKYRLIQNEDLSAIVYLDSGGITIPPIVYQVVTNDTTYSYQSDSVHITIKAIIRSTDLPQGIKEIILERRTIWDFMPWIIGGLLVALIAYFYFRKKSPDVLIEEDIIPSVPPLEEAIAALSQLQESQVWVTQPKNNQIELSQILRRYLEREFDIPALENTTGEIDRALVKFATPNQRLILIRLLNESDLVKFAKMTMPEDRQAESLENAIQWVKKNQKL